MNIKRTFISASILLAILSTSSQAEVVVDDNFAIDGTVETDAAYFGSSSTSAIEINTNSVGLVTGSSGRQMHALFDTQTLAEAGDSLTATLTFTTPVTVGVEGENLRFGLFDHLGRNTADQLSQNTSYSTDEPNALYMGLPGVLLQLDVESNDATTDIDIRRSDPSETGRLLATTTGFTAFGSGPDEGYVFDANTQYTVVFTLTRTDEDALEIIVDFGGATHTSIDESPGSFSFGMLAMGASGGAFGSSNEGGEDANIINDNGIDIDSFNVEFTPINPVVEEPVEEEPLVEPEPVETGTVVDDVFAIDGTDDSITDASYFASSTANAIEFNNDSIGIVSGSSSRQIHSLFETQSLENPGDLLEATITFTTPDTVGSEEEIRIGLFDHLDRTSDTELGQDTSFSSSEPNLDYSGLPGFYVELDVESTDPETDLDIRRSNPSETGRLLSTSSEFSSLGNSADIGYRFEPNTQYTIILSVQRTSEDALDITADFADSTFTATDLIPESFDIGMLAINVSSEAFGTSSTPGELDNGIDLDSVSIQLTAASSDDPASDDPASDDPASDDDSGSGGGGGGSYPFQMVLLGLVLFFRKQYFSIKNK